MTAVNDDITDVVVRATALLSRILAPGKIQTWSNPQDLQVPGSHRLAQDLIDSDVPRVAAVAGQYSQLAYSGLRDLTCSNSRTMRSMYHSLPPCTMATPLAAATASSTTSPYTSGNMPMTW